MKRALAYVVAVCAVAGAAGCVNGVKSSEYARGEVGVMARVEQGTVISSRYVTLTSLVPFGSGPGRVDRARGDRLGTKRRGLNLIVRVDRTGETLAVTQADDVFIGPGAGVWIEYGDRIRVSPRG